MFDFSSTCSLCCLYIFQPFLRQDEIFRAAQKDGFKKGPHTSVMSLFKMELFYGQQRLISGTEFKGVSSKNFGWFFLQNEWELVMNGHFCHYEQMEKKVIGLARRAVMLRLFITQEFVCSRSETIYDLLLNNGWTRATLSSDEGHFTRIFIIHSASLVTTLLRAINSSPLLFPKCFRLRWIHGSFLWTNYQSLIKCHTCCDSPDKLIGSDVGWSN